MKKTKVVVMLFLIAAIMMMSNLVGLAEGKTVSSVEMETLPLKDTYYEGDEISYEGASIRVTYDDGSSEVLPLDAEGVTYNKANSDKAGTKTVAVRYGGKRATFRISVLVQGIAIVFDWNYDGAENNKANVILGDKVEAPAEIPAREGYTFYKWYIDEACTMLYDFSQPVTKDATLYAMWLEDGASYHNVTYNFNYYGLAPNTHTQMVKDGETVRALAGTPERSEFTFDGWFTDTDGVSAFDAATPIAADTMIYACWTKTKTGESTYVFEAEQTDLTGKTGPGLSGDASEEGMIVIDEDQRGASEGKFVSYLYRQGLTLEFPFASSEAVESAKLAISLSSEFDITLNPENYQIILYNGLEDAGKVLDYEDMTFTRSDPFTDKVVFDIPLVEGYNMVQVKTNNSVNPAGEGMGTYRGTAPMVDCIRITTPSVLIWDANFSVPKQY